MIINLRETVKRAGFIETKKHGTKRGLSKQLSVYHCPVFFSVTSYGCRPYL
jgi:hypothetical protein